MYKLVKLFDKTELAVGETIEKFYFDAEGVAFAVETNKSVYLLEKATP